MVSKRWRAQPAESLLRAELAVVRRGDSHAVRETFRERVVERLVLMERQAE